MKIGDTVIIYGDLADTRSKVKGQIEAMEKSLRYEHTAWVQVNGQKYLAGFVWPAHAEDILDAVVKHREQLRKQLDDSMRVVYRLRNGIARGETGEQLSKSAWDHKTVADILKEGGL